MQRTERYLILRLTQNLMLRDFATATKTLQSLEAARGSKFTKLEEEDGLVVKAIEWLPGLNVHRDYHRQVVLWLLKNGCDPDSVCPSYSRYLHYAVFMKDQHLLKYLVAIGANLDIHLNQYSSDPALAFAVKDGYNLEAARQLIRAGANTLEILLQRCRDGDFDRVQFLAEAGADLNVADSETGFTPMHYVVQKDRLLCAIELLQRGAIVDTLDVRGQSPLHFVVNSRDSENMVRLLTCERGDANVNRQNQRGESPLHMAAKHGHELVVQALLRCGADPRILTYKEGATPLHYVALSKHDTKRSSIESIIKQLIHHDPGINIDAECLVNGSTPLDWASTHGQTNVAVFLIASGANASLA